MLKTVHIFVKTVKHFFFQNSLMNRKEQHLFEIEIFCNINTFNLSWLTKSIHFFNSCDGSVEHYACNRVDFTSEHYHCLSLFCTSCNSSSRGVNEHCDCKHTSTESPSGDQHCWLKGRHSGPASPATHSHQHFTLIKAVLIRAPEVINRGPFSGGTGRRGGDRRSLCRSRARSLWFARTEITPTTLLSRTGRKMAFKHYNYHTLLKFSNCPVELNGERKNTIPSADTVLHLKVFSGQLDAQTGLLSRSDIV